MEKRGIGHLEVILSFIIFIAAVGFALYFFSPTNGNRLGDSSLTYTLDEVEKNASSDILIYSVKVNNSAPSYISVNLSDNIAGKNIRVMDKFDSVLASKVEDPINGIVSFGEGVWPVNETIRIFIGTDYSAYSPIPSGGGRI